MKKKSICIATITRNRPKMLSQLFASLSKIKLYEHISLRFVIVENNDGYSLNAIVQNFRNSVPGWKVDYLLERDIGISSARNRALHYAIEQGFDLLVFVDDDEFIEPDWLLNLLAERERLDLDIVGSPVIPVPFDQHLAFWQRIVWTGIERNSQRSEIKCRRKWEKGTADTIKVATGSWMGKLDFFRRTGLKFDTRLGLTGGEDWHLWAEAKKLGAKTGWAPDAIAYETVPSCRLTLSYHFRRNRDHNITGFHASYRVCPKRALRKLPLKLLSRTFKLCTAICSLPFKGSQALVTCAATIGGIVGLLQACTGKRALHYAETTGF
ncbi:glycosyltransferase family 2 protein [Ochrobactrum sp. CM-21-5]|nr:glycosyltransferase [Ochrobactrum sp. CM-21-5]MBC2885061.1 glycosyltransferase family 2 protein [Ochrobactrum sp. CM-21-5]